MSRTTWLFGALIAIATPAASHDWYPTECCHALDCAPVESVQMIPAPQMALIFGTPANASVGGMAVTSKHGTVVVPANFPRRESRDNRMHVCMRPKPNDGGMRLICIFLPPAI